MSAPRPLHVLIAGGGLSGLALAHGLIKDGHTCEVFERDADLRRKTGYLLHMNSFGGDALKRCLPEDLYELYLQTSRRTPGRRESIVLTDQMHELSSQPHLGPPNEGDRPHTDVHRKTLRQILMSRLDGVVRTGVEVESYSETDDGVTIALSDGTNAHGDVLVAADGIRSVIRNARLPQIQRISTGIRGLGLYGRTDLTPELVADIPDLLVEGGMIIAADRQGARVLIGAYRPRQPVVEAAAQIAPDVTLDPVEDYLMVSCSVPPGTVVPPTAEWDDTTAKTIHDAMLVAIDGWHPAIREVVGNIELDSIFAVPFGFLAPGTVWEPSRVTLIGDAAHAMLPTIGMGANLALNDARMLLDHLGEVARGETDVVAAIGAYEQDMRELVYPFVQMTLEHDKHFGGGALSDRGGQPDTSADQPVGDQSNDEPAGEVVAEGGSTNSAVDELRNDGGPSRQEATA